MRLISSLTLLQLNSSGPRDGTPKLGQEAEWPRYSHQRRIELLRTIKNGHISSLRLLRCCGWVARVDCRFSIENSECPRRI